MTMQYEQFKFIYDDLKQQLKQIPIIQQLLSLTEKSTKKLQCINLYSSTDKKNFDLEIQDEEIMKDIIELYRNIQLFIEHPDQQSYVQTNNKIYKIKEKYMETFDSLNKQEQILTEQIEIAQYLIDEQHHDNQIKEVDEYDEEPKEQIEDRVLVLKREIDQISSKLAKINHGRGKWFQSDHNDFIKIYNRCGGNDKKILAQGVKVLGMKNTQIMDHLQVYQTFLQLEKEKKLISQQYRQIKTFEKLQLDEKQQNKEREKKEKERQLKQKHLEENKKKKELIQKFKEEKNQKKQLLLRDNERKDEEKKNAAIIARKKVQERAKKMLQIQSKVNSKNKYK